MAWVLAIFIIIPSIVAIVGILQGIMESQKREAMQDEIINSKLTRHLLEVIKQNESRISNIEFWSNGIYIDNIDIYRVREDTRKFTSDELMCLRDLCYKILDSNVFEKYDNREHGNCYIKRKEIKRTKNPFS